MTDYDNQSTYKILKQIQQNMIKKSPKIKLLEVQKVSKNQQIYSSDQSQLNHDDNLLDYLQADIQIKQQDHQNECLKKIKQKIKQLNRNHNHKIKKKESLSCQQMIQPYFDQIMELEQQTNNNPINCQKLQIEYIVQKQQIQYLRKINEIQKQQINKLRTLMKYVNTNQIKTMSQTSNIISQQKNYISLNENNLTEKNKRTEEFTKWRRMNTQTTNASTIIKKFQKEKVKRDLNATNSTKSKFKKY